MRQQSAIAIRYTWLLLTSFGAFAYLMVRDIKREHRQSKEMYALYLDVMALRDRKEQVPGLDRTELAHLIRWREGQHTSYAGSLASR